MVRAKFVCNSIEEYVTGKTVKLIAVASTSEENKVFTRYTPSGDIRIAIDKDAPAADSFKVGKEYYVDFTDAPTQ